MAGNETEEAGNQTIHCSKTEFGCCPDWYTPAERPNYGGCTSFVLGSCNETEHGCCPDEVSLARGPNLEGCGDPECAGSLFGCCKDRRTIAFGPHFKGCERSSFPCEISSFGCCPDGETVALSKEGAGCGTDCLLTKFGCCPDGNTTAKGINNEGSLLKSLLCLDDRQNEIEFENLLGEGDRSIQAGPVLHKIEELV